MPKIMDLQKAKILLDKINSLYKSMGIDEKNIAPIEQDLMRDYIRQLYEAFTLDVPKTAVLKTKTKVIKSRSTAPVAKPKAKKITPPAPPPAPKPEPKPEPEPVVVVKATPPPPAPEPVAVVKETPAPPPPPKVEPVVKPALTPKAKQAKEEHEILFEYKEAKELSEKLSELPIKDLSKAFGLNEKIFTISELFGGDQGAFERTITVLNSMKDYDEAKEYLSHNIADKFNWATKEKKKKAKNFIKLVRRRYK